MEVGKLAVLMVIGGHLLETLFEVENVAFSRVHGRLCETMTMNHMGHEPRERVPLWWPRDAGDEQFIGRSMDLPMVEGPVCSHGRHGYPKEAGR